MSGGKNLRGLFLAYRRELHAFLTAKLRDTDVAADLVQETFVRFSEQGSGTVVTSPRAYLYRTAHNLAVDHIRQRRRQRTDAVTHDEIAHLPDHQPTPLQTMEGRHQVSLLQAAVAELPARTREIFILNRLEGLTYAAIAAQLGISESSVQKHLAKALHQVMQRVGR